LFFAKVQQRKKSRITSTDKEWTDKNNSLPHFLSYEKAKEQAQILIDDCQWKYKTGSNSYIIDSETKHKVRTKYVYICKCHGHDCPAEVYYCTSKLFLATLDTINVTFLPLSMWLYVTQLGIVFNDRSKELGGKWATQRRYNHILKTESKCNKPHGIPKSLISLIDTLNSTGCTPTTVLDIVSDKMKEGQFAGVEPPSTQQIGERKQTVSCIYLNCINTILHMAQKYYYITTNIKFIII